MKKKIIAIIYLLAVILVISVVVLATNRYVDIKTEDMFEPSSNYIGSNLTSTFIPYIKITCAEDQILVLNYGNYTVNATLKDFCNAIINAKKNI